MRNVSGNICKENKITHFIFNNVFQNRVLYDIMYKNMEEPDTPQVTKWPIRIAYWIPKATVTHNS